MQSLAKSYEKKMLLIRSDCMRNDRLRNRFGVHADKFVFQRTHTRARDLKKKKKKKSCEVKQRIKRTMAPLACPKRE